jgi:signal transduction histidine kinase
VSEPRIASRPATAQTTGARLLLRFGLLALVALAVLFGGYEAVERTWFQDADPEFLFLLHRLRGAAAALIVAGIATLLILRAAPPLLAASAWHASSEGGRDPAAKQVHYARWFILMRWIALVAAALAVVAAIDVAELLPRIVAPPLTILIASLAIANIAYGLYVRRYGAGSGFLALQTYGDVLILVMLLHFSGGIENPLTPVLLLHVIIAGIVLGRAHSYLVAVTASVLFAGMAWGECFGIIRHYTFTVFPHFHAGGVLVHAAHDPLYVGSRVTLQAGILLLVAYFTTTLVQRIRADERQLEGLADRALAQARSLEVALAEQQEAQARVVRAERLAAVGELAGQVAHEVNNPIAIISAKARLLLRDGRAELPEKAGQEVAKIADLADRVARIAQGLLSYCRPAPGARAPLDASLPLRRALAYVESRAAAAGVQVRDELPAGLPQVHANANELEQVFLNLVLNALDAMPAGGELRIAAERDPPGQEGRLVIVVADTGTGIPPELLDRVFEPFLTTKGGQGSGLGLSICQGLVRSHGGDIRVESRVGAGTRVHVSLPTTGRADRGDPGAADDHAEETIHA